MKKHGFTLIELLVVIAIIGVLMVILFPALGRMREGARRIQCTGNLRQHGIAWYLYLDDHNERFPKETSGPGGPGDTHCNHVTFGGWQGKNPRFSNERYKAAYRPLNRYLDVVDRNSAKVFHCPDDIKPSPIRETCFDFFGNSYYFNGAILQFGSDEGRPLSTITRPHSKVYLEMCNYLITPGHGGKGPDDLLSPVNTPVMVLFVDGHVKGPYKRSSEFGDNRPVYTNPD